jgi:acyl-CoA synthetase (AMP-forming)/AMP-acid ligase II
MLSHRNLMTMCLQYCADVDQVLPGQTMLHVAPLSHGSGLYALPHLFGGGHQVIESAFTTDIVFESLHRYPAISMFAAPTMLSRLIRSAQGINNPAGNLLTAYYGGGPMYVSDLLQTLDLFGPKLFQVYGQGESPMTITGLSKRDHEGTRDSRHLERLASCGTARTGVEVRVVDDDGREVANGELGEVITRSDTRMLGYWNNEQATRSTIRDGWLWTGDIGTMDDMGYLTLRDRSKDMIIRGGSNIYPREIEEVLLRHPAIIEVSVIGREHADLGEEPIAFVVTQPGHVVTSDEMDALCLENMARFKRPREYIFSESLPKNNYGKILKTELRKKIKKGVA